MQQEEVGLGEWKTTCPVLSAFTQLWSKVTITECGSQAARQPPKKNITLFLRKSVIFEMEATDSKSYEALYGIKKTHVWAIFSPWLIRLQPAAWKGFHLLLQETKSLTTT